MKSKRVTFGGESYMVPAGKTPRSIAEAQRMEKALKAPTTAATAPSGSPATSTPKNSQRASSTPSRASAGTRSGQDRIDAVGRRVDKGRAARSGDPRTQAGYARIGASNPGTQGNTRNASRAYAEGRPSADSKGRVNYRGHESTYEDAAEANNAQLATRSRAFARGRKTNRNAAAVREMTIRDSEALKKAEQKYDSKRPE